jgi:hypothetical protein
MPRLSGDRVDIGAVELQIPRVAVGGRLTYYDNSTVPLIVASNALVTDRVARISMAVGLSCASRRMATTSAAGVLFIGHAARVAQGIVRVLQMQHPKASHRPVGAIHGKDRGKDRCC